MAFCILTGAGGGMGRAIAETLAGSHRVLGVDRSLGDSACHETIDGDVTEEAVATKAFEKALQSGESEIHLINCAGVTLPGIPQSAEAWNTTIGVNLTAPFLWSNQFLAAVTDHRIRQGGIIFIGSLATQLAFPGNPAYQASKAGVLGLSKAFAFELGSFGLRSNCVSPGYITTAMTEKSYADPNLRAARSRQTLLNRWGTPKDVAGVVAFLCSDAASYVTGINIFVDGGWTARGLIEAEPST